MHNMKNNDELNSLGVRKNSHQFKLKSLNANF